MTRKSNTTAKHKPTTTSRLSDPTAHKLTIHSLNDAQASCSCGGWSFARTGRATRAQIRSEWFMHKKFRTEFACIIPGCTGTKLEGRKYCAAHQERANGQTLAEKVREQREADAERANRQWLDGTDEDMRYPICPECQANLETPVDLLTCPDCGLRFAAHSEPISAPAIQSEQQYKDTLAAQNDRQRRNNEAQPESQPSKTWTRGAAFIYRVQFADYSILRLDTSVESARNWARKAFPKSRPTVHREYERMFCPSCESSPCVCLIEAKEREV